MKQSCKFCGAVVGVHQHMRSCPRFVPCLHCGNDISKNERKHGHLKYHAWCSPLIDDGIIEVTRP